MDVYVQVAVEGQLDESVAARLIEYCGARVGEVFGRKGKDHLRRHIQGYNNNAARYAAWLVIVDLDNMGCAPSLSQTWLPNKASSMCFRVAIQAVEAWLLADRSGIAKFLGVSVGQVPRTPEALLNPKETVVALAGQSRKSAIRKGIVPSPNSGRKVGPEYNSLLAGFVQTEWDVEAARLSAPSLDRAVRCLQALVQQSPRCA